MPKPESPRLLIVESPLYDEPLPTPLLEGAKAALNKPGATYESLPCQEAWRSPAAIAFNFDEDGSDYDGYVALGCVIRG